MTAFAESGTSNPVLTDVLFQHNSAVLKGFGGAFVSLGMNGENSPTLTNVTFYSNTGLLTVAYSNTVSSPVLNNVIFDSNAGAVGGAMLNAGYEAGVVQPTVTNTHFRNNRSFIDSDFQAALDRNEGGDAVTHALGGALVNLSFFGTTSLLMTDSTLDNNSAELGGALTNLALGGVADATLLNSTITNNQATDGGGIYGMSAAGSAGLTLTNVLLNDNSAGDQGGALTIRSMIGSTNLTITNTTVSSNTAGAGGAISMAGTGDYAQSNTLHLANSILWGNQAITSSDQISVSQAVTVMIASSLIEGGWNGTGVVANNASIADGGGNVDGDPLFVDMPADDLRLLVGSAALDRGDNSALPAGLITDLLGNPRIVNQMVDMGAYEAHGFTLTVSSGTVQTTTINSTFSAPLQISVTDSANDPIGAGGVITFVPPTSGAGLSSSTPFTAVTGADGTVTVTVTANSLAGSYVVTATASGVITPAFFTLHNQNALITTALTLTTTPNPVAAAAPLTLTANLSPTAAGAVQFYVDGDSFGVTQPLVLGMAKLMSTTLPAGTHVISATYGGAGLYQASLSNVVSQVVNAAPTPTPTVTPTATATDVPPTATATATATSTPEPTVTPTATATDVPPTATATATDVPSTATATATATSTSEPTVTPTATATDVPPTATVTETPEPTATGTLQPTATATETSTPEPTATGTLLPTATATETSTPEPTVTPTATATETSTPEPTATETLLPTATATETSTPEPTATGTLLPTATATATETSTPEPTATATLLPTATAMATETSTPEPTATGTLLPTATATETSTPEMTATGTLLPTATATATETSTPEPTATGTLLPTATATATETSTPEPTATETLLPTATATATETSTPEPTATGTLQPTATATATETSTPEPTVTPTATATETSTPEPTATGTLLPTATVTETSTPEPTATATVTNTPTPTVTLTNTPVPTATNTPVPGSITGLLFVDRNGNSTQEADEAGLAGAAVDLLLNGQVIQSTTTDGNGRYAYTSINPGNYRLRLVVPTGYVAGTATEQVVTLSGGNAATVNFGVQAQGTVGGVLYHDRNGNGRQESGEPGIGAATVTLANSSGQLAGITTDSNGTYQFSGLVPGVYDVDAAAPAAWIAQGATTKRVNLGSGGAAVSNFGYQQRGTLTGMVFRDLDGDGRQAHAENGVAGVTVQLFQNAQPLSTTLSSADGSYHFADLLPGSYLVVMTPPADFVAVAGVQQPVALAADSAAHVSFGLQPVSTIVGVVYADSNGDGVRQTGESGIANAALMLFSAGPDGIFRTGDEVLVASMSSSADGAYSFVNQAVGAYAVQVTTPTGYAATSPNEVVVNLAQFWTAIANFGNQALNSVAATTFADRNNNGRQDEGEEALAGLPVVLESAVEVRGGTAARTSRNGTTNSAGLVLFNNLPAGNYELSTEAPATGYVGSRTLAQITLAPNGSAGEHFGFQAIGTVAGTIFRDGDGHGRQGAGEGGLGGVVVTLTSQETAAVAAPRTSVTASDGSFTFSGLAAGNYQLVVTAPTGYGATAPATINFALSATGMDADQSW